MLRQKLPSVEVLAEYKKHHCLNQRLANRRRKDFIVNTLSISAI